MKINRRKFLQASAATSLLIPAKTCLAKTDSIEALMNNIKDFVEKLGQNTGNLKQEDYIKSEIQGGKNMNYIMQDIKENENHNNKQRLLNFALASFFGLKIIPYFMSHNSNKAFSLTIPIISAWYSFSNEETKHHFLAELEEASASVGIMVGIITAIESIKVFNIDKICDSEVRKNYGPELEELGETSNEIKEIFNSLNIEISNDENLNHIFIQNSEKIILPTSILVEILPLLKLGDLEDLKRKISFYFSDRQRRYLCIKLMSKTEKEYVAVGEVVKKNIDTLSAKIIKDEIYSILAFTFTTQLITGVGQATLLKQKIYHIANMLKNLAISNGATETDAKDIENKFIGTSISYLFNRHSFCSDLGPAMGAVVKGGISGLYDFIDGLTTVAFINIYPYLDSVGDLIYSTGVNDGYKGCGRTITQNDRGALEKIGGKIKNILSTSFSNFLTSGQRVQTPNFIQNKNIRKNINSNFIGVKYKGQEETIIKEINNLMQKNNLISDINSDKFASGIEILYILKKIYDEQELYREKIDILIEKYSGKLKIFYKNISKSKTRDIKKDVVVDILKFLDEKLDLGDSENGEKYIFGLIASKLSEESDENISEKAKKLQNLNGIFDLDFCLLAKTRKFGSIVGISNMIEKNIKFLIFLKGEKKYNELFEILLLNFKTNIQNINPEDFKKYSNYIEKNFSHENIDFLNLYSVFSFDKKNGKLNIEELNKKFEKNKGFFEKIFGKAFHNVEEFFEYGEEFLGINSFEVVQMILLIQTPYVLSVRETISSVIKTLPDDTKNDTKKYLVGLSTYVISMFADNYVGIVVGIELCKSLLGMSVPDSIKYIGKFSVIGGSKVITGNAPNAIVSKKGVPNFYDIGSLDTDIQKKYNCSFGKDTNTILLFISKIKNSLGIKSDVTLDLLYDSYSLHLTPSISELINKPTHKNALGIGMQLFRKKILGIIARM